MKAVKTARVASVAVILLGILLPTTALADTKPYFKVSGGDVFAGGWYDVTDSGVTTACVSSDANYQAPTFNPSKNTYKGGIFTYATVTNSARQGASADFGAIALGLIEGTSSNQYGFYSGTSSDGGTGISSLNFSNTNNLTTSYWGGYFAGTVPPVPHCIPDYFDAKQSNPGTPSSPVNVGSLGTAGSAKQYLINAPGQITDITSSAVATIANGKNVSLFVNGDVYISHNIIYQSGYDSDNTTKLAIVVQGNIYIDPSVTQIDGLYIAQPDLSSSADDGSIFTCADKSNTNPNGTYIRGCTNQLTVNGALIARQLNFLRVKGDVGDNNANPAEIINYTPAMVVGGPFFSNSNSAFELDSLSNLPPVF